MRNSPPLVHVPWLGICSAACVVLMVALPFVAALILAGVL